MRMKTSALLIGSAVSMMAGQAMATGFAVSEQSVSALGTAYAGSAVLSEDASNQWYNPATLAGLDQSQITADVQQVMIDTSFKSNGPSGPGDIKDLDPVVGSVYLALPLTDMMTFGLGINAPFGTKLEYDSNWGNQATDPLAPLSPTTGDRYATLSDVKTYNINPALGFQVSDGLRVGLGLSYQHIDADLRNSFTRLQGKDDGYGWNIGATFDADENNHFGVAYRSKVNFDLDGDITFKTTALLAQGLAPAMAGALAGTYSGKASLDLPASAQFSYAGDLSDNTQLLLGVEWMQWSSLDHLTVKSSAPGALGSTTQEFGWNNTTRYSVGLRHTLSNDTLLRFGVYQEDSSQHNENRSPSSPDSNKIAVTLGAGFKPADNMNIDVGYAHIFIEDAKTNLTDRGVLNGKYELAADVIGAQMTYRF
ncbi:MAG: outer membrane protein transport protein [Alcanivorax sp.]|nr:outer membrane protein transport protein [Alcanivorax sp.]